MATSSPQAALLCLYTTGDAMRVGRDGSNGQRRRAQGAGKKRAPTGTIPQGLKPQKEANPEWLFCHCEFTRAKRSLGASARASCAP